ncbi:hypothetical protein BDV33DRAFT_203834 [Aspergillus novoparasiticus]|uniref:Uncharacterized protein n=1 Tax=Aspergillus novoparasiticus TaxID=986946 RepID=A0A5N6ESU2_9EURO|nr:hypothetical protein BDV33DRAFT_203834 [Aspergillus novoparasiticus]
MVVVDLVWEWVVAMVIMGIMEVWVDLGLVDTMEDTMEDIMGEEGLVGIMVVDITAVEDIMEGVGDLLFLHGVMRFMCLYGFYDMC